MLELIKQIIPTLRFRFPYDVDDYANHLYFENYHCHKDFSNTSTPDCAETISAYAERNHDLGGKCLFSGEHGSQGNQFLVYKTAESSNLKYRHSTEAYWVKDRHEKDRKNCHIILVAKNDEGRKDINYILSIANESGYYYKPRIDLELLLNVPKDNIIVTSACVAGWNYDDADEIWLKIAKHFGDNFFFEVQYHNTDKQKQINQHILELADKHNIQIICGLDSHYVYSQNSVKRDMILKYKKVSYPDEQGWYLDYPDAQEIIKRFREQGILNDTQILTALMNTNIFVDECEEIVFDRHFKIPNIYPNTTYKQRVKIYHDILNQAYKKEKLKSPDKVAGIRFEANEVVESGVVDYFLFNHRLINDAVTKEGGILTTTSRGSAASFITNKLLGFTTIDRFSSEIPIYPERFLTKERVLAGQMPDIDYNIATQEPFVKAARNLVGEHGCYPLMAVEQLKEKAAWQLYAGANDVPPEIANQVSKYIDEYNEKLKYADDEDRENIHVEDFIPEKYLELYKQSLEYQKITINLKVHACGHLIFDGDIRKEIGLITAKSETTKKQILCACIEGSYLDEFGYVKDDFLIVDSVHLTHKFFESIGSPVPSFDELREMIYNDKETWEIYEKGITYCVNQLEKDSTSNKMRKYKAQNLAELSAFIAGIRPGFKSLLSTFLNRQEYSTGEKIIDELLSESSHFMLYQESIMKVLAYLDVPMGETYGIIKAISKKKLKGEKKETLERQLKESWVKKFGNLDNFNNVWNVIEDSARYAFNSPHALSMGGDSVYQAWFKAHHTAKFYEVAINHYQEKGKKDKIDALVKEIIQFYGYQLGNYEFGKDNRKVTIDAENKIIYPNISSIKGFGEQVGQILYELGLREYSSFVDVVTALESNGINKTTIDKLIKIGYFNQYGEIEMLLETVKLRELFYKAKEISQEKLQANNIPFDIVAQYGNKTLKKFTKLQSEDLLKALLNNMNPNPISQKDKMNWQNEILGLITIVNENENKRNYFVSGIDVKTKVVNITLYEIHSGKTRKVKMWTSQFNRNIFSVGDIIYISKIESKPVKEPTGRIDETTGKKEYREVEGKFEKWLTSYVVL